MNIARRILVTGCGGIGGVNFVRAAKLSGEYFVIGTDNNPYYSEFADVDERVRSPRHDDPGFLPLISRLVSKFRVEFIHPAPSVEALVISSNRDKISSKIFLPSSTVMVRDKLQTQLVLKSAGIPVPETFQVKGRSSIFRATSEILEGPYWVRAKTGAGGRLSLLCRSLEEVSLWMQLWVSLGRARYDDFVIQEYLPGQNVAWDSLWFKGKLVTSFARERLEYPFKHISPSGITGTPTVAKIIHNEDADRIGELSIKTLDPKPHGFYSLDLKGGRDGGLKVTEVDAGKFHTTAPLWGYGAVRGLKLPHCYNIAHLYVILGLSDTLPKDLPPRTNPYPEGIHLLRHLDCGAWFWREDGWKASIL